MDAQRSPRHLLRVAALAVLTLLVATSCTRLMVDETVLSSDAMNGRQNGTPGSAFAQSYLIESLKPFAVGLVPNQTGDAAFKQPFTGGTNVLAKIPGGDLANEYVIIGGHYDHIGNSCRTADPTDTICNGATDNAAGSAAVLEVGRLIAEAGTPRRTVILAFWDREEDGLLGSRFYTDNPLVPNASVAAYLNFDIQGANLLPSLRTSSFAVGAETGGARLTGAVKNAVGNGPLQTRLVSSIFGQGRSDYVNFTNVGVPNVFFSDSTGPCYHTAQDELEVVDFVKLDRQVKIAYRLAVDVITGARPTFSGTNPLATFDDAVSLAAVTNAAVGDLGRFTADQQTTLLQFRADLNAIVAAGPGAFDNTDVGTLVAGAASAVEILTSGTCDGFTR
jgi:hypothetical protein